MTSMKTGKPKILCTTCLSYMIDGQSGDGNGSTGWPAVTWAPATRPPQSPVVFSGPRRRAHPEVQARLFAELQEANLGEWPKYQELARLTYLQACLKEAVRLLPGVSLSLPRVVPAGGVDLHGHRLPAGTLLGANPFVMHGNPETFGENAEEFNPERWLGETSAQRNVAERSLLIWGGASRSCPGQYLAQLIMIKIIALILLKFKFESHWPKGQEITSQFVPRVKGMEGKFVPRL
jgi:cytochrome P450